MDSNFIRAEQVKGEIQDIVVDTGGVQEKAASLQKDFEQLKKDLDFENGVISAADRQISKLEASTSLSSQLSAIIQQVMEKAVQARARQQARDEAAKLAAVQAAAAAQAPAPSARPNYIPQHGGDRG
ncbi:MAG: hypothetical protein WA299_17180 [Candidatus Acidiferrum sp.]